MTPQDRDSFIARSADLRCSPCRGCGTDLDPRDLDDAGHCEECSREATVAAARAAGELGELLPSDFDPPEVAAEILAAERVARLAA